MYSPATSVALSEAFYSPGNFTGSTVPASPQMMLGCKKGTWAKCSGFSITTEMWKRKKKNQCCQVSRINTESKVSTGLLREHHQQYEVTYTSQNSHNKAS